MIQPYNFDLPFYQTRIGNYCYIKDYVNIADKNIKKRKSYMFRSWKFHQLTPYWYDYLIHQGYEDYMPIVLTNMVISLLDAFFERNGDGSYRILNSPFNITQDQDGYDITHNGERLFRVKYLHQLQNAYFLMTGVELHDNGLELIFPELNVEKVEIVPWIEQERNKNLIPQRVRRARSL